MGCRELSLRYLVLSNADDDPAYGIKDSAAQVRDASLFVTS